MACVGFGYVGICACFGLVLIGLWAGFDWALGWFCYTDWAALSSSVF